MRTGTKSLLFGAHQFALHPALVAVAYRRIYGRWPSWREAVCILVHDWGYLGCATMDGEDGKRHPALGGRIARALFGDDLGAWTENHSRSFAAMAGAEPSGLCWPDKLANAIYPARLYLFGCRLSGELAEYRAEADEYHRRTGKGIPASASDRAWFEWMTTYMHRQVARWRASGTWAEFRQQAGADPVFDRARAAGEVSDGGE